MPFLVIFGILVYVGVKVNLVLGVIGLLALWVAVDSDPLLREIEG